MISNMNEVVEVFDFLLSKSTEWKINDTDDIITASDPYKPLFVRFKAVQNGIVEIKNLANKNSGTSAVFIEDFMEWMISNKKFFPPK